MPLDQSLVAALHKKSPKALCDVDGRPQGRSSREGQSQACESIKKLIPTESVNKGDEKVSKSDVDDR